MNLQEKTILISGASKGIGFSLAEKLIEAGAFVIGLSRSKGELEKLSDNTYDHYACNIG